MSDISEPSPARGRSAAPGRAGANDPGEHGPKRKRMTKRSLMVTAGAAAAVSFALPWVTIQSLPKSLVPVDRQVIVMPPGGQVVVSSGSTGTGTGTGTRIGTGVRVAPATTAPAVATTRASAPAPPGA